MKVLKILGIHPTIISDGSISSEHSALFSILDALLQLHIISYMICILLQAAISIATCQRHIGKFLITWPFTLDPDGQP